MQTYGKRAPSLGGGGGGISYREREGGWSGHWHSPLLEHCKNKFVPSTSTSSQGKGIVVATVLLFV